MRVAQPTGKRGSQKWLQHAVNHAPETLQPSGLPQIAWRSPLLADDFAEYRDGAFLERIDLAALAAPLNQFWPRRGPQWDALGLAAHRPILVEAKAHVSEFLSPKTAASISSRQKIEAAFTLTKTKLGVVSDCDWMEQFYQYANRLAHLVWLHAQNIEAHLLFVDFVGDTEMNGPMHPETWHAIYQTADYVMGLPKKHDLSKFIHHVSPDVRQYSIEMQETAHL